MILSGNRDGIVVSMCLTLIPDPIGTGFDFVWYPQVHCKEDPQATPVSHSC